MNYFVTGIDTDSGKTLVSAILCEALGYDYWKPIQAGLPKDSDKIKELTSAANIFTEAYLLKTPASPHAAAKIDNIEITLNSITLPTQSGKLVIEGAGGCLVPLNNTDFIIDLVPKLKAEIILVCDLYLGSINHSLLSIKFLESRGYLVKGIIFNGDPNSESEQIILHHSNYPCLLKIKKENEVNHQIVKQYAQILNQNWND